MLYVMPVPVGAEILIVAVETMHVIGVVTLAVGAAGLAIAGLTVILVAVETQLVLFFAVRLYVPAAIPVKVPVVLV